MMPSNAVEVQLPHEHTNVVTTLKRLKSQLITLIVKLVLFHCSAVLDSHWLSFL